MSDIETVIVGVLVFVGGQAVQKFIMEPIQDQRRLIGEIASDIVFLGNIGPTSPEVAAAIVFPKDPVEAGRTIRSHGARLRASLWTIPFYGALAAIRIVHPRADILSASKQLIGWSNSLNSGQPGGFRDKVAELLDLPVE